MDVVPPSTPSPPSLTTTRTLLKVPAGDPWTFLLLDGVVFVLHLVKKEERLVLQLTLFEAITYDVHAELEIPGENFLSPELVKISNSRIGLVFRRDRTVFMLPVDYKKEASQFLLHPHPPRELVVIEDVISGSFHIRISVEAESSFLFVYEDAHLISSVRSAVYIYDLSTESLPVKDVTYIIPAREDFCVLEVLRFGSHAYLFNDTEISIHCISTGSFVRFPTPGLRPVAEERRKIAHAVPWREEHIVAINAYSQLCILDLRSFTWSVLPSSLPLNGGHPYLLSVSGDGQLGVLLRQGFKQLIKIHTAWLSVPSLEHLVGRETARKEAVRQRPHLLARTTLLPNLPTTSMANKDAPCILIGHFLLAFRLGVRIVHVIDSRTFSLLDSVSLPDNWYLWPSVVNMPGYPLFPRNRIHSLLQREGRPLLHGCRRDDVQDAAPPDGRQRSDLEYRSQPGTDPHLLPLGSQCKPSDLARPDRAEGRLSLAPPLTLLTTERVEHGSHRFRLLPSSDHSLPPVIVKEKCIYKSKTPVQFEVYEMDESGRINPQPSFSYETGGGEECALSALISNSEETVGTIKQMLKSRAESTQFRIVEVARAGGRILFMNETHVGLYDITARSFEIVDYKQKPVGTFAFEHYVTWRDRYIVAVTSFGALWYLDVETLRWHSLPDVYESRRDSGAFFLAVTNEGRVAVLLHNYHKSMNELRVYDLSINGESLELSRSPRMPDLKWKGEEEGEWNDEELFDLF